MKNKAVVIFFALIFFGAFPFLLAVAQEAALEPDSPDAAAQARQDLRKQIEERIGELERVNEELQQTENDLKNKRSERRSLQQELNTLQYTINQLNLNIRADEISIDKLNLEIQSLTYDIEDIELLIQNKKQAITKIFRKLQQSDKENLFVVFLRNASLAEGIFELQALNDLNNQLTIDIADLHELQSEYTHKVDELDKNKVQVIRNQQNLKNRKYIVEDNKQGRQILLTETKNKEGVYQKQLEELKKLQNEISEEIESIDAELRAQIDPSILPPPGPKVLGVPVEGKVMVTQRYGRTDFAKKAYPGNTHNGVDFGAPLGTPILAAESGEVIAVGDQDAYKGCYRGAYGKFIVINHGNNLTTLYAHLSRYIVAKGDTVKRGDIIGYVGNTGYATGPHLHLTVYAQPTFYMGPSRICGPMPHGGDLNPTRYLAI